MRSLLTWVVLLTFAGGVSAQQGPLDLIPEDAAIAISIRNLNELRKRGDDFIAESGIRVPFRPSELLNQLYAFLGIRGGVDPEGSAAVVFFRSPASTAFGPAELDHGLMGIFPFDDLDRLASSFGFKAGELKPEQFGEGKGQIFGKQFYARGKHLLMANTKTPIERFLKSKPVRTELSTAQQESSAQADIFLHLGAAAWITERLSFQREMERAVEKIEDREEAKVAKDLVECLPEVRFNLTTLRVDKGLGLNSMVAFQKQGTKSRDVLAGLREGLGKSQLTGLPEGRVVFGHAVSGSGAKNVVFARFVLNTFLKGFLDTQQILSASDYPSLVGVFSEVAQRLRGTRSTLYLTSNEQKLGLFSLVAILDADDPQAFLKEMRLLAWMAEGKGLDLSQKNDAAEIDIGKLIKDLSDANFRVRSSATTRLRLIGEPALPYLVKAITKPVDLETQRRAEQLRAQIEQVAAERRRELLSKDIARSLHPSFVFHAKPEKRGGQDIDIVELRLGAKELPAVSSMRQLLGPDWDKIRIGVHGKQVVALIGSEVELLDATLDNLKNNRPGLAAAKMLAPFRQQSSSNRSVEFHASLHTFLALIGDKKELPPLGPATSLTSFSVTVETDRVQFDLWIPSSDVRVIVKNAFGF